MAVYAQISDVEAQWRPLQGGETTAATALLERVSALMRLHVADLDAQVAAKPDLALVASGVAVDAVLRVLRNPDGKVSEQIDDYSYRRSDAVADGSLYLTDSEVALIGGEPPPVAAARGAFTIRPGAG